MSALSKARNYMLKHYAKELGIKNNKKKNNRPNTQKKKRAKVIKRELCGSVGEKKIASFLDENGVKYIREYNMQEEGKSTLFFDFYLPKYRLLIEFDGPQHFKPVYGEECLKRQKANDARKAKWAKKKKLILLRISYLWYHDIENIITEKIDKIAPIV